jgi:nucleoside 2-deoxyribosyltransferase
MKVYLAGPITGLTLGEADDWRLVAEAAMRDLGMQPLSPLRAEKFLSEYGVLETSYIGATPMVTDRGIMVRDHWDVSRCDAVLFYLTGAKRVSIGTMMELAWAYAYRKPVVCVMEKEGNPHEHSMVREALSYRVERLDDAIDLLNILKEA